MLAVLLCMHFKYWNDALGSQGSTVSIKGSGKMCFLCCCVLVRRKKWGEKGRRQHGQWSKDWVNNIEFCSVNKIQYGSSPSPSPWSHLQSCVIFRDMPRLNHYIPHEIKDHKRNMLSCVLLLRTQNEMAGYPQWLNWPDSRTFCAERDSLTTNRKHQII